MHQVHIDDNSFEVPAKWKILSKKNIGVFSKLCYTYNCYAPIAQGIEWHTPNVKVAGSNPVRRTSDRTDIRWETIVYGFFFCAFRFLQNGVT